jgi:hypothetical protein
LSSTITTTCSTRQLSRHLLLLLLLLLMLFVVVVVLLLLLLLFLGLRLFRSADYTAVDSSANLPRNPWSTGMQATPADNRPSCKSFNGNFAVDLMESPSSLREAASEQRTTAIQLVTDHSTILSNFQ